MYDFDTVIDRTGTGAAKWEMAPEAVRKAGEIPLSVADMELKCPPQVVEAIKKAAEHGVCGYTMVDDAYFNAVRGFYMRRHNYEIKREWLFVTHGVVSALRTAVRAMTEPGDGVLVLTPVYYPFYMVIESGARKVVRSGLMLKDGRYEINFEQFEWLCKKPETKMLIMSSPHNPVGRVWTRDELEKIARICKENNVIILSDEIHCDIIMPGHKFVSMMTVPEAVDNCIVCTAMSKTFNLAGLSASDIFIPGEAVREKFSKQLNSEGNFGLNYFARAASISAHTECDGWIDEMLAYIEGNYQLMYDFIGKRLPELDCIRGEGTYLAWIDMRALGLSNKEQERMDVEEAHLALDEGYVFGADGSGFSRWNIAVPQSVLKAALERFAAAVDALQASRGLR